MSWFKNWAPVLVWMVVIFSASSDTMSFEHSSRLTEPLLRWLFPHLSERTIHTVVFVIRKCAHLTEYAILALLLWRALRLFPTIGVSFWPRAGWALLLVVLYAASDEFHQRFVPSREASVLDVLIDTTGAALGLLFVLVFGRWRRR